MFSEFNVLYLKRPKSCINPLSKGLIYNQEPIKNEY